MAEFTVFTRRFWSIGTHESGTYTVQPGETEITFTFYKNGDWLDQPEVNTISWTIQRSPDGISWFPMVSTGSLSGDGGVSPPKPHSVSCTIDGIVGQQIRGFINLNARMRFGIEAVTT